PEVINNLYRVQIEFSVGTRESQELFGVPLRCPSPKVHLGCIFNNFIRQLAARTDDAVLQLQQSRSPLPTLAAALPSAQAHPWRATNGFVTGDNMRNNFSKCGANGFRLGQSHDRDTRDESNRLFFLRMDFAKDSGRL